MYILYADDDDEDLALFRDSFDEFPEYELRTFADGQEVLEHLQVADDMPSLIILDINMPRLNGFQTIRELEADERFKSIPIVLFSTSDFQVANLEVNLHRVRALRKPYSYTEYKELIGQLLESVLPLDPSR